MVPAPTIGAHFAQRHPAQAHAQDQVQPAQVEDVPVAAVGHVQVAVQIVGQYPELQPRDPERGLELRPEQAAQQQMEQAEPEIHGYDDCYRTAGTLVYDDCLSKEPAVSPRPSDAPQRVMDAAAQMLARVGLNATSIREVTKLAEAPLGSTYHHFPGGKQELLARATWPATRSRRCWWRCWRWGGAGPAAVPGDVARASAALRIPRRLPGAGRCRGRAGGVHGQPTVPRPPRCSRAGTATSPRRSSPKAMPRQRRVSWPAW